MAVARLLLTCVALVVVAWAHGDEISARGSASTRQAKLVVVRELELCHAVPIWSHGERQLHCAEHAGGGHLVTRPDSNIFMLIDSNTRVAETTCDTVRGRPVKPDVLWLVCQAPARMPCQRVVSFEA